MTDHIKDIEYLNEPILMKMKKTSITKRLFRKHHYTQPVVKSRFLRRNRNINKKNPSIDFNEDSSS